MSDTPTAGSSWRYNGPDWGRSRDRRPDRYFTAGQIVTVREVVPADVSGTGPGDCVVFCWEALTKTLAGEPVALIDGHRTIEDRLADGTVITRQRSVRVRDKRAQTYGRRPTERAMSMTLDDFAVLFEEVV